jgi:hypothetical protein
MNINVIPYFLRSSESAKQVAQLLPKFKKDFPCSSVTITDTMDAATLSGVKYQEICLSDDRTGLPSIVNINFMTSNHGFYGNSISVSFIR